MIPLPKNFEDKSSYEEMLGLILHKCNINDSFTDSNNIAITTAPWESYFDEKYSFHDDAYEETDDIKPTPSYSCTASQVN